MNGLSNPPQLPQTRKTAAHIPGWEKYEATHLLLSICCFFSPDRWLDNPSPFINYIYPFVVPENPHVLGSGRIQGPEGRKAVAIVADGPSRSLGQGLSLQAGMGGGVDFQPGKEKTRNVYLGLVWEGRKDGEGYPTWKTRFCGLIPLIFSMFHTIEQFHSWALKLGKVGSQPTANTYTLGYTG